MLRILGLTLGSGRNVKDVEYEWIGGKCSTQYPEQYFRQVKLSALMKTNLRIE